MLKRKIETDSPEKFKVQEKLVGTWQLESFVSEKEQGDAKFPFGEKPKGRLCYDWDNHVGVHIMKDNRQKIDAKTHYVANGQDAQRMVNEFFGYFGTYDIDTEQKLVEHTLEGHICPNNVGDKFVRQYDFSEDGKLALTMKNDPSKKLTWTKISGNAKTVVSNQDADTSNGSEKSLKI